MSTPAAQLVTKTTLLSWNTQGSPSEGTKGVVYEAAITSIDGPMVVLLQEGGLKSEAIPAGFSSVQGTAIGTEHARCTNYVLVRDNVGLPKPEAVVLKNGESLVVTGGVAGRTPAAAKVGRTLFVSWHGTSGVGADVLDTFIKTLQADRVFATYRRIVVGGDFNVKPDKLKELVGRDRRVENFTVQLAMPGKPTYPSKGAILDYFLIFSAPDFNTSQDDLDVYVTPAAASDHHPIWIQLGVAS